MLPNFLIIGAPRAGTTWIHSNLRVHPNVFMPATKELHFFDKNYEKGMKHYESYFSGHRGQLAIGEATPAYLHGQYSTNDIPLLIYQHLPDVKLIASLRNPAERLYSRYLNSKAMFDRNAELDFEGKLLDRPEYIQEGFYCEQLKRFLRYFPRSQMLILLYDDLMADPRAYYVQICRFLGVDPAHANRVQTSRINAATGKKNLGKSRMLWHVHRGLSRAGLYGAAERVRIWNAVKTDPVSKEVEERVIELYRTANADLESLIGKDLGHWNTFGWKQ